MDVRSILTGAMLICATTSAQSQTLSTASLPSFASSPDAFALAPSPGWNGFPATTGFFAFSKSNDMFGGTAAYSGYTHKFSNDVYLSVRGGSGYSPFGGLGSNFAASGNGLSGFEFATTQFRLGYDMGRLKPYVTGSFAVATPVYGNALAPPGTSLNTMLNPPGNTRSVTSLGAGFDFAVTNRLSFGVGVAVHNVNGGATPLSPFGFR